MTRPIAAAFRAVRDRLAKLPRSQRWIAGTVAGAILIAAAVATTANASPATPTAQSTQTRVDQRANRDFVRTPTTPSIAPSTMAPTTPAAPKTVAPKIAPQTTAPRVTPKATTAKPKPLAVPTSCSGYSGAQRTACALLPTFGFSTSEMAALIPMWNRESGWDYTAYNSSSGAYGIPQALPGSKMAVYGSDWQTNPATQIKWGLSYIKSRYGSPSAAWSFWQANGWY